MALSNEVSRLRANFNKNGTKSYEFRIRQLKQLKLFLNENEALIQDALHHDLRRPLFEGVGAEVLFVHTEINYLVRNLAKWMKPTSTSVPIWLAPASSEIFYVPYGLCLILGPFNYPLSLVLNALAGAIAAGNAVVMKPSEMTTAVEKLLSTLLPKYLDPDYYFVTSGGVSVTTELLSLRWDKIFFTGSTRVGKIVSKAAAENLTPVVLELGGKSPTIIDKSVGDIELAAQRILWGKCLNAGQTCIAPDYIYCHESVYDNFLAYLKIKAKKFYGDDPQKSTSYGRIVNSTHWKRLNEILQDCKPNQISFGGRSDVDDLYIEPTVLVDIDPKTSKAMSDEIFGPILPVFKFKELDEVINHVRQGEKPLTLYIFARKRPVVDYIMNNIESGSVSVNDTVFHFTNLYAPFGGVGQSGMGSYHGFFSFQCFSHQRSVLSRDDHMILDDPIRYPPYSNSLEFFRFGTSLPIFQPAINSETLQNALLWLLSVAVSSLAVLFYLGKLN